MSSGHSEHEHELMISVYEDIIHTVSTPCVWDLWNDNYSHLWSNSRRLL